MGSPSEARLGATHILDGLASVNLFAERVTYRRRRGVVATFAAPLVVYKYTNALTGTVSCIASLLMQVSGEVEAELKPRLRGLGGFLIAGYLPQAWVFATESDVVSFFVDSQGNASVASGRARAPDVTIETSHALLSTVLRTRNPASVPRGPLRVTPHIPKGRTAFQFLRSLTKVNSRGYGQ